MSRWRRSWAVLRRRGLGYPFRLLAIQLGPALGLALLRGLEGRPRWRAAGLAGIGVALVALTSAALVRGGWIWIPAALAWTLPAIVTALWWLDRAPRVPRPDPSDPQDAPPLAEWWPAAAEAGASDGSVLARIDNDGRVRSEIGFPVPGMPAVDAARFEARRRYRLSIEAWRGCALVRKDFGSDRGAFRRESAVLARLAGVRGCPRLWRVDLRSATLWKALAPGPTLRDLMVGRGARILSVDTDRDPALEGLDPIERLEAVWRRGWAALDGGASEEGTATPDEIRRRLARGVDRLHRAGVTGFSLTFGNIVVDPVAGEPTFLDFDTARVHRRAEGTLFRWRRDRDLRDLYRIHGIRGWTERSARRALRARLSTGYAPVDLGRGLVNRGFWSVDSGSGRWTEINRSVLADWIRDARVLDLGTHNALMPLHMLTSGARAVTAVEREPGPLGVARALHALFEWNEMRPLDLRLVRGEMLETLRAIDGRFDLVTAFCSLYYLDEREMEEAVERIGRCAARVVLQCKTDTRAEAHDDKARKSSLEFTLRLLESRGFVVERVVAPPGFTRPLVLARRAASSDGEETPA